MPAVQQGCALIDNANLTVNQLPPFAAAGVNSIVTFFGTSDTSDITTAVHSLSALTSCLDLSVKSAKIDPVSAAITFGKAITAIRTAVNVTLSGNSQTTTQFLTSTVAVLNRLMLVIKSLAQNLEIPRNQKRQTGNGDQLHDILKLFMDRLLANRNCGDASQTQSGSDILVYTALSSVNGTIFYHKINQKMINCLFITKSVWNFNIIL